MGSIIQAPVRRHAAVDGNFEMASARDLIKRSWTPLDVSSVCDGLRLQPHALVVVKGAPGAGKSTFSLALANTSSRSVVVYNPEERLGAAVGERLSRLSIHRDDFFVVGRCTVDELTAFCKKVKAFVLVVDSVQVTTLLPSDLRSLINYLGLDYILACSQVTKDNDIRGSRTLEHEADVLIDIDDGRWSIVKSRFGPTGVFGEVVFDAKRPDSGENI